MIITTCLLLAACTKEPTQENIQKAVAVEFGEAKNTLPVADALLGQDNLMSQAMTFKLVESKKMGDCIKKDDDKTFTCDVNIVIENPLLGKQGKTLKIDFMKADDGSWLVVNEE